MSNLIKDLTRQAELARTGKAVNSDIIERAIEHLEIRDEIIKDKDSILYSISLMLKSGIEEPNHDYHHDLPYLCSNLLDVVYELDFKIYSLFKESKDK